MTKHAPRSVPCRSCGASLALSSEVLETGRVDCACGKSYNVRGNASTGLNKQKDAPRNRRPAEESQSDTGESQGKQETIPSQRRAAGKSRGVPQSHLLGRYDLVRQLGRGGFGEVWEAVDIHLQRQVALKLALFTPGEEKKAKRFLLEGRAAARLGHPNIAAVFDAGMIDERHYLAVELIDGQDLDSLYRNSPTPPNPGRCAELVRDLAAALDYAHSESIIHRDIKPQNIVLTNEGVPKIIDFGLAKILEDQAGQTVDGTVMGTPAFMAPEQARGAIQEMGPHSDQYSLGATLYWLMTGKRPFEGPYATLITQVIRSEPTKPTSVRPGIPAALEAICLKAMSKHPRDRYESCSAFAEDLARFLRGEDVQAAPLTTYQKGIRLVRRYPKAARLAIVSAMILLLGVSVAVFATIQASEQLALARQASQNLERELKTQREIEESSRQILAETEIATKRIEEAKQKAIAKKAEIEQANQYLQRVAVEKLRLASAQSLEKNRVEQTIAKLEAQSKATQNVLQLSSKLAESFGTKKKEEIYDHLWKRKFYRHGSTAKYYRERLLEVPVVERDYIWKCMVTILAQPPCVFLPVLVIGEQSIPLGPPRPDIAVTIGEEIAGKHNSNRTPRYVLKIGRHNFPIEILERAITQGSNNYPSVRSVFERSGIRVTCLAYENGISIQIGEQIYQLPLQHDFTPLDDLDDRMERIESSWVESERAWNAKGLNNDESRRIKKFACSSIRSELSRIPLERRGFHWRILATLAINQSKKLRYFGPITQIPNQGKLSSSVRYHHLTQNGTTTAQVYLEAIGLSHFHVEVDLPNGSLRQMNSGDNSIWFLTDDTLLFFYWNNNTNGLYKVVLAETDAL